MPRLFDVMTITLVALCSILCSPSAHADWIDLGDEGSHLWIVADIQLPNAPVSTGLMFSTFDGQARFSFGINSQRKSRVWVYDHHEQSNEVVGIAPGESARVVIHITTHSSENDRVQLKVLGVDDELPLLAPAHWDLTNEGGQTSANLSRLEASSDRAAERVLALRIGGTWEEVRGAGTSLMDDLQPGPAEMDLSQPHPKNNTSSSLMLNLDNGGDANTLDFKTLPRIAGRHAVVSAPDDEWKFRLHSYVEWFDGQYWCIWSHGPKIEDYPSQHVRYATSKDGINWSLPQELAPPPGGIYGYIARGLWVRNGELIALASRFNDHGFANNQLRLEGFRLDASGDAWESLGVIRDNTLNNFPPKQLSDGRWMMSRRSWQRDVSMLVGGVDAIDQWDEFELTTYNSDQGHRAEEPYWYELPGNKSIVGLFRNNAGKRLLRAYSSDSGRTWSQLVETNFPDATSKFFVEHTSRGYYVMVSNANPQGRYPLCLSVSRDGLVYTQMGVLDIPFVEEPYQKPGHGMPPNNQTLQYPHILERDGNLLIVYSRNKRMIETFYVSLDEVEKSLGL